MLGSSYILLPNQNHTPQAPENPNGTNSSSFLMRLSILSKYKLLLSFSNLDKYEYDCNESPRVTGLSPSLINKVFLRLKGNLLEIAEE